MSAIYTIPDYLPKNLKDYVKPLIKADQSLNVVNPLERLISYYVMKEVWDTLPTFPDDMTISENGKEMTVVDSTTHIRFLNLVIGHPSLFGQPYGFITIPSDVEQREAYLSIQKNFESIISTLQTLSTVKLAKKDIDGKSIFKEGSIQDGWNILEEAIRRCAITMLVSNKIEDPKQLAELIFNLSDLNAHQNVQDILETMTFAAIAAVQAESSNLPKRRNISEAKIHSFILYISEYFIKNFNQPFDHLVAVTTNVAFDFDDKVTENTVYKLRNSSKPKSKTQLIK